jgi:WD40 repeat protein
VVSLEAIEERVGRRERRNVVRTLVVAGALFLAAGVTLAVAIRAVRSTESDLQRSLTVVLARLPHGATQVTSAAFDPEGTYVVTTTAGGAATVWDWDDGKIVARLQQEPPLADAAFSPDGQLVVLASDAGNGARVWRWRDRAMLRTLAAGTPVSRAEFDSAGRRVVTVSRRTATVWDWRTGRVLAILEHPGAVTSAAFGPDGSVVTAASDGARVWSEPVGAPSTPNVVGDEVPTYDAAFGPQRVIVTGTDGTAAVYHLDRSAREPPLIYAGAVTSVSFNGDGTRILTSSSAGAALIWPRRTTPDTSPLVLRGQGASEMFEAAYSLDGDLVVTASSDGNADVYRPSELP